MASRFLDVEPKAGRGGERGGRSFGRRGPARGGGRYLEFPYPALKSGAEPSQKREEAQSFRTPGDEPKRTELRPVYKGSKFRKARKIQED